MAKKKNIIEQYLPESKEGRISLAVSEVAFFAALYYFLYLLQVPANVIGATVLLFVLINVSIFACPFMRNCCK